MGRKIKLISTLLAGMVILWAGIPVLVQTQTVQIRLLEAVKSRIPAETRIENISFKWLPLPHITLFNVRIENEQAHIRLPASDLYPKWTSLLRASLEIGRCKLVRPSVSITQWGTPHRKMPSSTREPRKKARKKAGPALPFYTVGKIELENGSLWIDRAAIISDLPGHGPLAFKNVSGSVLPAAGRLSADISCDPPYGTSLKLRGNFTPSTRSYRFFLFLKDFKIHELVPDSLRRGDLYPVDSVINVQGMIEGSGFSTFKANLKGDSPCIRIETIGKEDVLFSCGAADFVLEKKQDVFSLHVNSLELIDPPISISGNLSRRISTKRKGHHWKIDLSAADADLAAVRKKVLAIFGDRKTATKVCEILGGGSAGSAGFVFDGNTSDFGKLESMTITADIRDAPVHVPKVHLNLSGATGKIRIERGTLYGKNLSARLGKHLGTNGTLLLDLVGENRNFALDVDFEADLPTLPPVLHKLVKHKTFRKELKKFKNIKGWASGHLHLGEKLDHIAVVADVTDTDFATLYERLSEPIHIHRGRARIQPSKTPCVVTWENVEASSPSHKVRATDGNVTWTADEIYLHINRMDGSFDARSLHHELTSHPGLKRALSGVLSEINGTLEVAGASLSGPVKNPEKWKYRLAVTSRGVRWSSPLLPAPVSSTSVSATLTQRKATLEKCLCRLPATTLEISGILNHSLLSNWNGRLEFNGVVGKIFSDWLKKRHWIPDLYFPKLPCALQDFHVAWKPEVVEIIGSIGSKTREAKNFRASLDFTYSPEHLTIRDITFLSSGEKGELSLDYQTAQGKHLFFSWDGTLESQTLDALLDENRLLAGYITGSFSLGYVPQAPTPADLEGSLKAHSASWPWGPLRPVYIDALDISGKSQHATVKTLNIRLDDETVQMNGECSPTEHGFLLDMNMYSPELRWETLKSFFVKPSEKNNIEPGLTPSEEIKTIPTLEEALKMEHASTWGLTTGINFDIGRFSYSGRDDNVSKTRWGGGPSVWKQVRGRLTIPSEEPLSIDLQSARRCGLIISGFWKMGQEGTFAISTDPDKTPMFEDVFPCLGFDQDIIEGAFVVKGTFHGVPDDWRSGSLEIRSDTGRIRRMTLLSKILSVVNVFDLFSGQTLSDLTARGFAYSGMDIKLSIQENQLNIHNAVIKGEGLNLIGNGTVDLASLDSDLTIMIAPLKTLDVLVTKVPLVGKAVTGEKNAIVTIPVGMRGNIRDPDITILPPEAVGEGLFGLLKRTLKAPFTILAPILPGEN